MGEQKVFTPQCDLDAVRERFVEWRKNRKQGTRIPQPLWDAAVKLAQAYSVNEVSRALGIDYNDLKKRVDQISSDPQSTRGGFLELDLSAKGTSSECAIELQRPDGAVMRVSIKGAMGSHLVDLAKAFWMGP